MSTIPVLPGQTEPNPSNGAIGSAHQITNLDEVRQRSEASQRFAAAFGGIVTVLMNSPGYSHHTLSDLKRQIVPAVVSGQFSLAQARSKDSGDVRPVGVVLWASVSDEVDQRLTAEIEAAVRLQPNEWRSGPILWIVEGIGERGVVASQIRRLREKEWRGHAVKIKVRGQQGAPIIRMLSPA